MLIHGSCHCGNVTFTLSWEPDPAEIPARACDCTFCQKHAGVWTSNPTGQLEVTIADPSKVSEYAFGTRTAQFHICAQCGVVPVVTSLIAGRMYAVVNVNAFENVPPARLRRAPVTFGAEDVEARLARRAKGWIADVRFSPASR
jgi:hypothetical protein